MQHTCVQEMPEQPAGSVHADQQPTQLQQPKSFNILHHQPQHHFTPIPGVELYFEGSKSYWKQRANVDILIVCHTSNHCVEVIVFDPERNLEANRLYLNSVLLASKVDMKELHMKLAERKESLLRQKKKESEFNPISLTKELLIQAMVNFILMRLQIVTLNEKKFEIALSPMTGDCTVSVPVPVETVVAANTSADTGEGATDAKPSEGEREGAAVENTDAGGVRVVLDVLYPQCPPLLIPILCKFAKKFNSADINSTLNHLKLEEDALKSATKLAELATSTVDGFKLMLAEKIRLEQEMRKRYSINRLRWIHAINRVMVQNYVKKVRVRLIAMGMWREPVASESSSSSHHGPLGSRFHIPPIHIPLPSRAHSMNNMKVVRKTLDNSLLSELNGNASNLAASHSLPNIAASQQTTALPAIQGATGINIKRRERSNKVEAARARRSLNTEIFNAVVNKEKRSPTYHNPDGPAPTLMQSYRQMSKRLEPVTPVAMLSELKGIGSQAGIGSQKYPVLVKE